MARGPGSWHFWGGLRPHQLHQATCQNMSWVLANAKLNSQSNGASLVFGFAVVPELCACKVYPKSQVWSSQPKVGLTPQPGGPPRCVRGLNGGFWTWAIRICGWRHEQMWTKGQTLPSCSPHAGTSHLAPKCTPHAQVHHLAPSFKDVAPRGKTPP